MKKQLSVDEIVTLLKLEPLSAEGGMFRQTWRSRENVGEKNMGTVIYFFLSGKSFSHLHRLPTDEVYHWYAGSPVEMLRLSPDGTGERIILGNDLAEGQLPQIVMPAGCWQGSHLPSAPQLASGDAWALMGTTMSPGFTPDDYEHGSRDRLVSQYPAFRELIEQLTGDVIYR